MSDQQSTQTTLIPLASFDGSDGDIPLGNVTVDAVGDVFGTTYAGGDYGGGAAYELVAGSGQITKLFSFGQTTPAGRYVLGANPDSGLVEDKAGNLYGTTEAGGPSTSDTADSLSSFGVGTVFEIPAGTSTAQVLYSPTTVQSFSGYVFENDGRTPASGLIMDAQGNLFGTTSEDGSTNSAGVSTGGGTVFEIAAGTHAETTLGVLPDNSVGPHDARLVEDSAGDLFGTTVGGGASGGGSIFEVVKGSGVVTTLASFDGSADGSTGFGPESGLVLDAAGDLYGTARGGGSEGGGTVFELAAGSHTITPIVSFDGSDANGLGFAPWSDLLMDAAGNLYGTTSDAGSIYDSNVFKVAAGTHALTVLATLPGQTEAAGLAVDAAGNLYGTINDRGANPYGSIFELTNTGFVVSTPPSVTFASAPTADNAHAAALGSAAGASADPLTVALTADASYATGSNVTLANGMLTYTPGLITAAQVGPDTLAYTVTDTVTGAVTTETQIVTLGNGPMPVLTLASTPTATNASPATLGTAAAGFDNDALSVQLQSDADFATGSTLTLSNGQLLYTPALVTAAQAGSDALVYTVTDTVTGAVTTETQAVELGNGPAPTVTLASMPSATDASPALLGTAAASFGSDPLAVTLTSDADFASGSALTLSSGNLVYTPGLVTAANAGPDTLTYTVADTVTGAVSSETQAVTLLPATLTTLVSFTGSNGETPSFEDLTLDAAGNLYGTTKQGGNAGAGTVFELVKGTSTVTTLASFNYDNGSNPYAGLTIDAAGNLYGTTEEDGVAFVNDGTVFEVAKGSGTITTLVGFIGSNGAHPYAGLTSDAAGNLYSTTEAGGSANDGTVFELAKGSGSVTTLASFTGSNGAFPYAGLTADAAGNLYGTTFLGGSAGGGTIFELVKGTSTLTTLASFTGSDGADPYSGLTVDAAGNLYGTTNGGGSAYDGTVFELANGSGTITTLVSFTGSNGARPYAGLTLDAAGNLYGTTSAGGSANDGTVFEVAKGTSTVTTLISFTGSNGADPIGGLTADAAGNLYGTTSAGGSAGYGTAFELSGSGFVVAPAVTLASSPNADNAHTAVLGSATAAASGDVLTVTLTSDADFANGSSLVLSNGSLVYTPGLVTAAEVGSDTLAYTITDTVTGAVTTEAQAVTLGAGPAPVVTFASKPSAANGVTATLGTAVAGFGSDALSVNLTSDADFATGSTLALTNGSLIYTPGLVTAAKVGSDAVSYTVTDTVTGAVTTETQAVTLSPATLTTLANFNGSDGANPFAGVTVDPAGILYGTTRGGGDFDYGTVFEFDAKTQSLSSLVQFGDVSGAFADGRLATDAAGNLYSTTNGGGYAFDGTAFELSPANKTFNSLLTFNGSSTSGALPFGGLISDAYGNLYGTTQYTNGIGSGSGTVFEISAGSHVLTTLATLDGNDGSNLIGPLVIDAAGNLYGTAEAGGSAGDGTVFEVAAGTHALTTLATFDGSNGSNPYAGLAMDAAGNLYGTTESGGSNSLGTVFEIASATHLLTTLTTFDGSNGANPYGGLTIDAAGNLYGTTNAGGSANDGTVFKIDSGTGALTTLVTFDGSNGASPLQSLLTPDSAGNLYGTTEAGGSDGDGTIFELSGTGFVAAAAPTISGGATVEATTSEAPVTPFGNVTVSDTNGGAIDTLTINLGGAGGTLSGSGLSGGTGGIYSLTGSAAAVTSALDALTFTPTAGQPGTSSTTTFTLSDQSTAYASAVTAGGFSVVDTDPAPPIVTLAASPTATNAQAATLGIATPATTGDGLAVKLTSDADFTSGSTLTLNNGSLIYTPGLVTAAQVGSDKLAYTVTDTTTGAVTSETQTVTLGNGPAPLVTLAASTATATNASPALLGTATAGFGSDPLTVTLTSDGDFVSGSTVALSGNSLLYTPGAVTAANAGSDTIAYTVTDGVTGAVSIETQTVSLSPALLTTLASFTGGNGENPYAGLTADAAGDLFGTTAYGGSAGDGTVFELVKNASSVTTLASFTGGNGELPPADLTADAAGDLFGTTYDGGSAGDGTVFELVKNASSVTTLASFTGGNGANPYAGLTADAAGDLFGTTYDGGSAGDGTVFELVKNASSVTTLASFTGGNGAHPDAGLIADAAGDLFGTTAYGGSAGDGTVFELVKNASSVTTLASFTGGNGAYPFAGLTADAAGDLFGTTARGGSADDGTVFELVKNASSVTTLASFTRGNGAVPDAGLTADAAGDLFGTTEVGGSGGHGTVFELVKNASSVTTLASFTDGNGAYPFAGLTADAAGDLFGTTRGGGSAGDGTVFELTSAGFVVAIPPTISGGTATHATTSEIPVSPFSGVTIGDANAGATDTLTISLGGAGGTLSGAGLSGGTGGVYTLTNSAGAVTSALDALVFTPAAGQPNTSGTTTFSLSDTSTAYGMAVTSGGFSVVDTDPAPPIVSLAASPAATNVQAATLGTATPATTGDGLAVQLTADADFTSGSTLALSGGNLVYTPGLVTAAKVGLDQLAYTVTDTTTGAVTSETQTVTLGNGPAPVVTPASTPTATNATPAVLGTALAGFGTDALSATLTGDSTFGAAGTGGGTLALSGGKIIYTPGLVTTANAGADALAYTVTDTRTGAAVNEAQTVSLDPGPSAGPASASVSVGQSVDLTGAILQAAKPGLPGDTITLVSDNTNGTLGGVALKDGGLTYTASGAALAGLAQGNSAADSFGYTVADQFGDLASGTVTLKIMQPVTTLSGPAYGGGTLTQQPGVTIINASDWSNTINAFAGDATINAGNGNATVNGGGGSLTVNFDGWSNVVTAGSGNDTVSGSQGNSIVTLGSGNDTVDTGGWNNAITLGSGNDTINAGQGNATVSAGNGNDAVTLGGWSNVVTAGNGDDTVSGSQGNSVITLGNGNDTVTTAGWSNVIAVGSGNDTVDAGQGNASVSTKGGNDNITLRGYGNSVTSPGGNNTILGSTSDGGNTISLGYGNQTVTLGGWNNVVSLAGGTNNVVAGAGGTTLVAGPGDTTVTLNGWNNNVILGTGTNSVTSGAGNDLIHLSGGNATLVLTGSSDIAFLGGSSATITDSSSFLDLQVAQGGTDVIDGFGVSRGSIVDLVGGAGGFATGAAVMQALVNDGHGGAFLNLGGNASIDFLNVAPGSFTTTNFRIG